LSMFISLSWLPHTLLSHMFSIYVHISHPINSHYIIYLTKP
jgi:hypothetical protein